MHGAPRREIRPVAELADLAGEQAVDDIKIRNGNLSFECTSRLVILGTLRGCYARSYDEEK
jgi:hypothetical protein